MNQVEYSLPNNQYREQTRTLSLCWMNVPELGIGQGEEYLRILAGELLRIEVLAIRCACLGKNTVPINTMGIGSESCQRCSMSLKVVLNHITLSEGKWYVCFNIINGEQEKIEEEDNGKDRWWDQRSDIGGNIRRRSFGWSGYWCWDLGWCEIGDDGVYYLSKVISKQT